MPHIEFISMLPLFPQRGLCEGTCLDLEVRDSLEPLQSTVHSTKFGGFLHVCNVIWLCNPAFPFQHKYSGSKVRLLDRCIVSGGEG